MFCKGTLFPERLHCVLDFAEDNGLENVISWTRNGLAFTVHDPDRLAETLLPVFFQSKQFRSFNRQLNHWCFHRIGTGSNNSKSSSAATFSHPYFIRGKKSLCENLTRDSFKRTPIMKSATVNSKKTESKRFQSLDKKLILSQLPVETLSGNSKSSSSSSHVESTPSKSLDYPCHIQSSPSSSDTAWELMASMVNISNNEGNTRTNIGVQQDDFRNGDAVEFEGRNFYFIDLNVDIFVPDMQPSIPGSSSPQSILEIPSSYFQNDADVSSSPILHGLHSIPFISA